MHGVCDLLAQLSGARVLGACAQPVLRVHTDTRTLAPGDLFVALRGERFDAHDFVPQARAQGAVAALAERGLAEAGLPGAEVPDSRVALGELARLWRARYQGPLIAVTGSNGKTTVTQMVATILRAAQPDHTHATQGNLNNDIGVPLTLLRLREHHRLSVVALGWPPWPSPRWPWSTTPSANTRNSWARSKRWRAKTARCCKPSPAMGWRCSPVTIPTPLCGTAWLQAAVS
jgi:UDP-N-acetylmuramoyl-tripeptide--D-alanyl-D-alanine ligase